MFVVTNREMKDSIDSPDQMGGSPNRNGPNELRLLRADHVDGKWRLAAVPDRLSGDLKKEIGLPVTKPAVGSQYVAVKLRESLATRPRDQRSLLLYVHGFNNDFADVLDRARRLSELYSVEVLPFSWPSDGGGIKGVLSYKRDKQDARVSAGALSRFLKGVQTYVTRFNEEIKQQIVKEAEAQFDRNAEKRDAYIAGKLKDACPVEISILFHSMGNYLYKQVVESSAYDGTDLLSRNVIMAAADVNNDGHRAWIERVPFTNRLYVTINEDDYALKASRVKTGGDQLARLGHYPYHLDSENAVYVNFTDADLVGTDHAYFEGGPTTNPRIRGFFQRAFTGQRAEMGLDYHVARNLYSIA
jgi:esterase/lipase superfamily enzyme